MPWRTFLRITRKTIRFAINRPIQRFNIENRAKDHLGPDAKLFKPAPRITTHSSEQRNQSLSVKDKEFITGASKLEVKKHVTAIETDCDKKQKSMRALPKSTNLSLQDPASIWVTSKVPAGRLCLNTLQEVMINKLADEDYWTPRVIADKYNIKEDYAANLTKYLRQIKIVVSPRLAKALDTVGSKDENYQATKHIIYHVDNSLRTESDRKYDDMYSQSEQLDPEVRKILEPFAKKLIHKSLAEGNRIVKKPEPLRLSALNQEDKSSHKTKNSICPSRERIT